MNEQLLKDFIATAQKYNYDWNTAFGKFPELNGYDQQLLKDYVATAEKENYNYDIVNSKFPEFGIQTTTPDLKKKDQAVSTELPSGVSSSALPSKPKTDFEIATAKARGEYIPPTGTLQEQVKAAGQAAMGDSYMGGNIPYEKTDVFKKEEDKKATAEFKAATTSEEDFASSLGKINKELIDFDEDYIAPQLNFMFGNYGFTFNQALLGREAIEVVAPNGKKKVIAVDTFSNKKDLESSNELKAFIDENKPKIISMADQYNQYSKRFVNEEEIAKSFKAINEEANSLKQEQNRVAAQYAAVQKEMEYLSTPAAKSSPDYQQRLDKFNADSQEINNTIKKLSEKESNVIANQKKLDKSVGMYSQMKSEQGGIFGAMLNSADISIGQSGASKLNLFTDLITSIVPLEYQMGEEEYRKSFIEKAISSGIDVPPTLNKENFNSWVDKLNEDVRDNIDSKIIDENRKSVKQEMLPVVRTGLVQLIGDKGTTKEYMQKKQEEYIAGGLIGLAGSAPAIALRMGSGAVGAAEFFLLGMDATMQQMSDPKFKDISENEKYAVAVPVGIVNAVLEEFGLRNVIGKSGVVNNILTSVLNKTTKPTTAKSFKELVENEIQSGIARGVLTFGAAGLAEAETGAAQAAAEIGIQEIYNTVKEKKLFQTPNSMGEFVDEVLKSGIQEAVGGFVMGMPSAISTAYGENNYNGVTDEDLTAFQAFANDENIRNAFGIKLKNDINSGKITAEQGKKILNDYTAAAGLLNTLPDGLDNSQKRKALGLIQERQKLENEILNKDQALTKKQRSRIDEINTELEAIAEVKAEVVAETPEQVKAREDRISLIESQISDDNVSIAETGQGKLLPEVRTDLQTELQTLKAEQDAIQKQAAGQVPVQPTAGGRQEMAQGEPQAEPEVTTQEGQAKAEEVKAGGVGVGVDEKFTAKGGNQVVDEKGEPLTVYHGTNIESDKKLDADKPLRGLFFTKNKQVAKGYANKKGDGSGTVREAKISLKNPHIIDAKGKSYDEIIVDLDKVDMATGKGVSKKMTTDEIVDALRGRRSEKIITSLYGKKEKADGIIIKNVRDNFTNQGEPTDIYIPFSNEQIAEAPKAKPTEAKPISQEVSELEQMFPEMKAGEPQGISVSNKTQVSQLESKTTDTKKRSIIKAATTAINTLKSIFPEMDIVLHDNEGSYDAQMGAVKGRAGSAGNFAVMRNADGKVVGGRIDINLNKANMRTVAHEVAHAVMLKSFGENPALFKAFRNNISKILSESTVKKLNDFASQYSESESHEEFLVELAAALTENEYQLPTSTVQKIAELINKVVSKITNGRLQPFTGTVQTKELIDFLNTMSSAIGKGEAIELNGGGEVGTFNIASKSQVVAPKATDDSRSFIRDLVEDIDIREFNGMPFVTNMYDYTNAGVTDLGNGFSINMMGGKSYVPYIMSLQNKKIGDISNLSAFNSKENAEAFIRNALGGKANLFAPHSGTMSESWQFQQHTFSELVNLVLDKGIMSNDELISVFNNTIKSNADNKKAFNAFNEKYKEENISNFDSFKSNPKKIVDLLDIQNNFSPDLRKALNNAIAADKTFQKAIGIKNKEQFYERIMDPLNKGVKGGEIISVIKFDPKTLQVVKTDPNNPIDHHPSFGWAVLAKIDGIYQPSEFHKSSSVTKTYTKYNKGGKQVSRKSEESEFEKKNVSSSAGAIPKVAKLSAPKKTTGGVVSKSQVASEVKEMEDTFTVSKSQIDDATKTYRITGGLTYSDAIKSIKDSLLADEKILVSDSEKDELADNIIKYIFIPSIEEKRTSQKITNLQGLANAIYEGALGNWNEIKNEYISSNEYESAMAAIRLSKEIKDNPRNFADELKAIAYGLKLPSYIEKQFKGEMPYEKVISKSQKAENEIKKVIKDARAQGYSEDGIKAFLMKKGLTEQEVDVLMKDTEAGKKIELGEELMPGYDKMMEDVDAKILDGLNRNAKQETILNNVMKLVEESDAYKNATDQQREQITRDVKKAFGEKMKSAPSAKKILGFLKDVKKVTMDEIALLNKQFNDMAKGAKDKAVAIKKATVALTESLDDLVKGGKITTKQLNSIIKRFGRTNVLNPSSVERFVNYMTKVFADADYAEKIANAYAQAKIAKKNIQTKIGIAEELYPSLNRIFSINPELIPDDVFEKYLELVDMFGQRKQVLELDEKQKVTEAAKEVVDAIDEEISLSESLAIVFSEYEDKVLDDDGKLDYSATVNKMVEDGVITQDDAKIMRKYKSKISPSAKKAPKTEAEIEQEKKDLLSALKNVTLETENLPTNDEREVARKLDRLIQSDAVKKMDNAQLINLLRVIDNINNGYLPRYAEVMLESLNAKVEGANLKNAINSAKPLSKTKLYARLKSIFTRKDAITEMVRRSPLSYIDQVFGNFKSKDIFNSLFKAAAEAETLFRSNMTKIQNKLDEAQEAVAKSFGNDPNETLMSKFKMMTYMVQLEYLSNPNSEQVNPAAEYLKATIKHIDEGKSSFGERDAEMLQEILDKYKDADGNIDIDKLYNSFNAAEKNALATIKEINESLREKAVFTSSIIRGDKINTLNNYVHLNVLHDSKPDDAISGVTSAEAYNNSLKPSTKAKSLISRTGKVAPLNFDVFASAQRGAKFLLMDYYLTVPIRTARKTINEATAMMEEDGRIPKEKRQILNAISSAFEESTENLLNNVFVTNSFADDAVNYMSKTGYRAVLGSVPRFIAELTSNIGFALFADPKALSTGYQYRDIIMSSDAVKILNNLGSKQTNRIFPHEALAGRLIDSSIMSQASGIKGGRAKGDVANVIQKIYNNSIKKYKNSVELVADTLISTPDKIVMRPLWIGSFANEFKRITGNDVDFEKIASNDQDYMLENKDALDDARDLADEISVLTGATDNAYMDILKGKVKPNQSALTRAFNMFNNYMTRFAIYEYTTARTGIMAAMGNGSLSRKQGVALMAGVTTRMVVYTLLAQSLSSGMVGLFSDDEEEEDEKSLGKKLGQAFASVATSLILGRDFGNATKTLINYGVERVNEKFLDELREGEYDPYKDAIQYTIVPPDKQGKKTTLTDYLANMGGPFGPSLKTADLIVRKMSEGPKKEQDAIERSEKEMNVRIPLEVLGNVGLIPLYKDIRKITMKNIYKDLEKAEKSPEAKQDDFKPYGLNKEELKKYMPDLYEQYYGEETNYAKTREQKAKLRKKKDELRRKILDEKYNYISPKKKVSEFGKGSDFGKGSKFGSK
jgi:hypothetical protein